MLLYKHWLLCLTVSCPVCVVSFEVCHILLSCDFRTPTPLSALILMLSGRYRNERSPLDPLLGFTQAANTLSSLLLLTSSHPES